MTTTMATTTTMMSSFSDDHSEGSSSSMEDCFDHPTHHPISNNSTNDNNHHPHGRQRRTHSVTSPAQLMSKMIPKNLGDSKLIPHMPNMPHVPMPHVDLRATLQTGKKNVAKTGRSTFRVLKKATRVSYGAMSRATNQTVGAVTHATNQTVGAVTHVTNQTVGAVTHVTNQTVGAVTHVTNQTVGGVIHVTNQTVGAVTHVTNVSVGALGKATNASVGAVTHVANVSVDSMAKATNKSGRALGKAANVSYGSVKTAATTVGSLLGDNPIVTPIVTTINNVRRRPSSREFETPFTNNETRHSNGDLTAASHDLSDSTADSLMLWEGLEEDDGDQTATDAGEHDDQFPSVRLSTHEEARLHNSAATVTSTSWNNSDLEGCLLKLNDRFPMDDTFHDSYSMGKSLGQGSFGSVRRCHSTKDNSGTSYAVKSVPLAKYDPEEIEILRDLQDCPQVVQVEEVFVDHSRNAPADDTNIMIVMEEIAGGELLDRIACMECYPEDQAKILFRALLETVQFCHSKGIAHCDIKPENIMLTSMADDTDIKLVDFGLARRFQSKTDGSTIRLMEMHGSPEYAAPEVFNRDENTGGDGYDERCDIWSLGVVLYVLLGGYGPFEAETDHPDDMIRAVAQGKIKFHKKYWKDISREAKILIARMITIDPEKRISLEEALASPWFMEGNEEEETETEQGGEEQQEPPLVCSAKSA